MILRIVVLAAGFSTRLGKPKALARIHGTSLLRRTLGVVHGVAGARVIVVVPVKFQRYRNEARGFGVDFVVNPRRSAGLSSSVVCALGASRFASAVLLLPVDLSGLERRDLMSLVSQWRSRRRMVVARRIGTSGGTPLILPRWLFARAAKTTGDRGLRDLVTGLPSDQRTLVNMPSADADVDTAQQLAAARRSLRPTSK